MKQLICDLNTGGVAFLETPVPQIGPQDLLIHTRCTLVSPGTERMLLGFGRANPLQKIKQQPEKFKQVLEKIKTDGLLTTIESVQRKLAEPLPLGYCNVGTVVQTGDQVTGFKVGDRVVSNGPHAEYVVRSKLLCEKIPDSVSDETAVFTVLASIALQGVRLANLTLGETVAVIGTGLIGLITVQLLRASGCHVVALDFSEERLNFAKKFGATPVNLLQVDNPVKICEELTQNKGVDAVIIAAATQSDDPIKQAAQMSRKRGRIVLVGVSGLNISRADFYEKELTFQVSCSYGPGRYDESYEKNAIDYPYAYVRWTEQRNFSAILALMADGRCDMESMITTRCAFDEAPAAFENLMNNPSVLALLLSYPQKNVAINHTIFTKKTSENSIKKTDTIIVGFIGAGNYARQMLLPALSRCETRLLSIASHTGFAAADLAKKFQFEEVTTDALSVCRHVQINTVFVVTQHHSHAKWVLEALNHGKHVFVEKPLCLTIEELEAIKKAKVKAENCQLVVGFNRRFSPHIQKIKALLSTQISPKVITMTINAGAIPITHWIQDQKVGGGRIIGEACHFIDLARYMAGASITSWQVMGLDTVTQDTAIITLKFSDGSIATVNYLANGAKSYPKENIKIFCNEKVIELHNFKKTMGYGFKKFSCFKTFKQNKGQEACLKAFFASIKGGYAAPIGWEEIEEVSRVVIEINKSLNFASAVRI